MIGSDQWIIFIPWNIVKRLLTWLGYACPRTVGLGLEDVAADPVPEVAGQRVAAVVEELHTKVAAGKHEPLLVTTK